MTFFHCNQADSSMRQSSKVSQNHSSIHPLIKVKRTITMTFASVSFRAAALVLTIITAFAQGRTSRPRGDQRRTVANGDDVTDLTKVRANRLTFSKKKV